MSLASTTADIMRMNPDIGLGRAYGEAISERMSAFRERMSPGNIVRRITGSDLLGVLTDRATGKYKREAQAVERGDVAPKSVGGKNAVPILQRIEKTLRGASNLLEAIFVELQKQAGRMIRQQLKDDVASDFDKEKQEEQNILNHHMLEDLDAIAGHSRTEGTATRIGKGSGGGTFGPGSFMGELLAASEAGALGAFAGTVLKALGTAVAEAFLGGLAALGLTAVVVAFGKLAVDGLQAGIKDFQKTKEWSSAIQQAVSVIYADIVTGFGLFGDKLKAELGLMDLRTPDSKQNQEVVEWLRKNLGGIGRFITRTYGYESPSGFHLFSGPDTQRDDRPPPGTNAPAQTQTPNPVMGNPPQQFNFENLPSESWLKHSAERTPWSAPRANPSYYKATLGLPMVPEAVTGMENNGIQISPDIAAQFFIRKGYKPVEAAAIAANLQHESNLMTGIVGDGGQAFGIAQWHPDRQAGLKRLAKESKTSIYDPMTQLEFVHQELQTTENGAFQAMKAFEAKNPNATAAELADIFALRYERPNPSFAHLENRERLATQIYGRIPNVSASLDNTTPPTVTSSVTPNSTGLPLEKATDQNAAMKEDAGRHNNVAAVVNAPSSRVVNNSQTTVLGGINTGPMDGSIRAAYSDNAQKIYGGFA